MDQQIIDQFMRLVDSLKRHQRADVFDNAENIIEELYTDPIEGDFILKSMLQEQSTILIGRKGTGKSTIINRFQHEVRKTKDKVSLYVDVKTIYDQSSGSLPSYTLREELLSPNELKKFLLYKHFLTSVLEEIKSEINKNVFSNRFVKFFSGKGLTENEFQKGIENLFNDLQKQQFEDVSAIKQIKKVLTNENRNTKRDKDKREIEIGPEFSASKEGVSLKVGSVGFEDSSEVSHEKSELKNEEYSTALLRTFNLFDFINKIKDLLAKLDIKLVYLCLDDSSELEREALDIFVRTIVVPFNNSSNGFFKFKITFYPGRDHLPGIDRTKVETLNLDYYYLYLSTGVDRIEENAINYTRRLLERRLSYYFGDNFYIGELLDLRTNTVEEFYKIIFQASANVTRLIGKLLWYAAKRSIIQGNKINKRILQESAREHYEQEIELILTKNEYMQYKHYSEKLEREHLKNLLNLLVTKAKENKRHIASSTSEIFKDYNQSNAASNYIYFPPKLEDYLLTLELNFFISKYTQQKDRGSGGGKNYIPPKEVSVYTLNYGLCQKENIIYDEKSDRKYRIERVFDFTETILHWLKTARIIRCTNCGELHPIEKLEAIQQLGMICDKCYKKTCKIETVSIDLPEQTENIIDERYFQVLNVLKIENWLTSQQIAQELDVSYQSVNQRIRYDRTLMINNYIEKREEKGISKYNITEKAVDIYFT